jgi:hypothetical protein
MVIDMSLVYDTILGRLFMHQINVIISTRYLTLKFLTKKEVAMVRRNQVTLRQCIFTCLKEKKKKALVLDQQRSLKERVEVRTKVTEESKYVLLRENE